MINNKSLLLRLLFAAVAIAACIGLSLRPIPSSSSPNDTGRYVVFQSEACKLPALADAEPSLSQRMFNLIARPTCWTGEPRIFLFSASMALPLALIAFGDWRREGALLLAVGLLLSMIGFELMTNALRQAASLIFLLGALSFRRRAPQLIAVTAALLMHDSTWAFAPLILIVNLKDSPLLKRKWFLIVWAIPILAFCAYLFELRFISTLGEDASLIYLYSGKYSEESTGAFLLFMVLPLCWIFLVRFFDTSIGLSRGEKLTFWYSSGILVMTAIFFPAITYRFAMTAAVLQIFMAMKAVDLSVRSSLAISAGLVIHLFIYTAISRNVWMVLNG